tara:strand:- start:443 stop:937 length:495 start_codon:yes stop_codon:yes gene_type:complete
MIIFLKTINGITVTLDVEGSDTYEDVVTKINEQLDSIYPLITENPRIIIDGRGELKPNNRVADLGVSLKDSGSIFDIGPNLRLRKAGTWVEKLSPDRKSIYIKYSRKAEYGAHKRRMETNADLDLDLGESGGGRKKRKSRRTRRKGIKRKGSRRGRKSRRTRRR